MISVPRKSLGSQQFQMAIRKLAAQALPAKAAYQVKKLVDAVQRALRDMGKEYQEQIVGPYLAKDEKGEVTRNEDGTLKAIEGKQVEYEAAESAFGEAEVKIDRDPLSLDLIQSLRFSAAEIDFLMPFLTEDREVHVQEAAPTIHLAK